MALINITINESVSDPFKIQLNNIERLIMTTQAQIDTLAAQVTKIIAEVQSATAVVQAEVASLKAQLEQMGQPVDLTALQAAVDVLDAINPDVVAVDPAA